MAAEKQKPEVKKMVDEVLALMEDILSDRSVPRNIRAKVEDSKKKIELDSMDCVNFGSAIYSLDDICNDINMPSHTRTEIWSLISQIESIKEKMK